jgi:CRP-like cAMP-binding protein
VPATVETALRGVVLFRELTDDELAVLARQATVRRHDRQTIIFSQGDPGDGLYLLLDGHVGISRQNVDGNELLLSVHERGEYFGELALFDSEPRSATAVAIDDCTLLFLSKAGFRAFLSDHPAALFTCLEVLTRRLRQLTDLADEIALLDIRSRLARRLLRLATQGIVASGDAGSGRAAGEFRVTQQQLASMLGATRESVNKHLNALVDAGIIRMERGRIRILDLARLRAASEGLPAR